MDPQSSRARHLSVCLDWLPPYKLHHIYMEHVNALTNFANLVSNSSPPSLIRWTTCDVEWSSFNQNICISLVLRTRVVLWTKMFACSQDNLTWPSETIDIYTWWCRKGGGAYSKPSIVVVVYTRICNFTCTKLYNNAVTFHISNIAYLSHAFSPFLAFKLGKSFNVGKKKVSSTPSLIRCNKLASSPIVEHVGP